MRPAYRLVGGRRGQLVSFFALASALLALTVSSGVLAFCRTTTCNPNVTCEEEPEECCILDGDGCDTNGLVVAWPSLCASYAIHDTDSVKRGITSQQLSDTVDAALARWQGVTCDDRTPSIAAENQGWNACGEVTYNSESNAYNANVWMFRDDEWPYSEADAGAGAVDASALALTTITFNWRLGRIVGADVEVNTAQAAFTLGDDVVDVDLDAVVTHEAGHFLGLDHSYVDGATMAPGYPPRTTDQRTLSADDEAGICDAYPLDRGLSGDTCEPGLPPEGTAVTECGAPLPGSGGCSVSSAGAAGSEWPFASLLLGGLLFGGRRLSLGRRPLHGEPCR